ncbi:MAG TPA: carboxypeptidase-like regulatory domain-containing protein [Terriglobales bacterium]|nr:carboxypeptidase-like regulatory domain-containing protein [Terriglobales bacterium]
MRRAGEWTAMALLGLGLAGASGAPPRGAVAGRRDGGGSGAGQTSQPVLGRSVSGVVRNQLNQPLRSAIVYLKNERTKVIRTAITDSEGTYGFHQLEANVSYEVYAVWQGHRSPSRVDSEYETEKNLRLNLTVPVG